MSPLFFQEITGEEQDGGGYLLKNIAGEQTVCLHVQLASSRWYYLKIIPLKDCVPRLLALKNALIAGILIGFALLAVCSLGVLLFLYFPVYQVRAALRNVGLEKKGALAGQVSQLAQQSEAHRRAGALQAFLEGRDASQLPELPCPYILALAETQGAAPLFRQTHPQLCAMTCHQNGCEVILFCGEEPAEVLRICRGLTDLPGVYCFCGSARESLSQVAECYQVLCELRRQKFWTADQHWYLEEDFASRRPHSSFTEQMSTDLISSLRGTDLAQLQSLWQHIQDSIREDRFQDQLFTFRRISSLLEKQLPALKPLASNDFWAQLSDIWALDAKFTDAFRRIVQNNQELHKAHIDQLALLVSQRIEQDYADADLSPTRIADELGMSSHAVETIAGEVGFSNAKYFYVVFKNLTGQTPLQFRKSHAAPGDG